MLGVWVAKGQNLRVWGMAVHLAIDILVLKYSFSIGHISDRSRRCDKEKAVPGT